NFCPLEPEVAARRRPIGEGRMRRRAAIIVKRYDHQVPAMKISWLMGEPRTAAGTGQWTCDSHHARRRRAAVAPQIREPADGVTKPARPLPKDFAIAADSLAPSLTSFLEGCRRRQLRQRPRAGIICRLLRRCCANGFSHRRNFGSAGYGLRAAHR